LLSALNKEGKEVDDAYGHVLDHDKDRRKIHQRLRERAAKDVYITFSGPLIRPGYEVMFRCGND